MTRTPPDRPAGVILAGGVSRRLGGGDKTLRALGDRPLLAAIVDRIAPQCRWLLLSANGDPTRFAPFGLEVVPDEPELAGAGPLAGVLASLDAIAAWDPDCLWALVVTADAPFVPADLVTRFLAVQPPSPRVAIARCGDRDHPLIALWPVAARPALRRALQNHPRRRVLEVVRELGAAVAVWPAGGDDPFFNVNTPDDLAQARRLMAAQ